jgi:hypothetical protein
MTLLVLLVMALGSANPVRCRPYSLLRDSTRVFGPGDLESGEAVNMAPTTRLPITPWSKRRASMLSGRRNMVDACHIVPDATGRNPSTVQTSGLI